MSAGRFLFRLFLVIAGAFGAYAGARAGSRVQSSSPKRGADARDERSDQRSEDATESGSDRPDEDAEPSRRTVAEWTTLAVSGLVVVLLVGAALYEHFGREEPPGVRIAVEVAIDRAEDRDGVTYIPFTVANTGSEPAENVMIRFEIKQGDETVEESTTEFAFLANSGSAEGELATTLDLDTHTVEGQVTTIQKP